MWPNLQKMVALVTFTEEFLDERLTFCAGSTENAVWRYSPRDYGMNVLESLVHKKIFGLKWQVVFKLEYLFC